MATGLVLTERVSARPRASYVNVASAVVPAVLIDVSLSPRS